MRRPSPSKGGSRGYRVRAAPAVSCANCAKETHTSIQVKRRHPASPAQWLYGLWRALPGDEFCLATVAGGLTVLRGPVGPAKTSANLASATDAGTTRFCRTQ